MTQDLKGLVDIIRLMAKAEEAMAEFYKSCSQVWDEEKDFWLRLEKAEIRHVKNLDRMIKIIEKNPDQFQKGQPFNPGVMKSFISTIENNILWIQDEPMKKRNILNIASNLEQSSLEKLSTEFIKTDDIEYQVLINQIIQDEVAHKMIIDKKIYDYVKKTDNLLASLAKVENNISKVYEWFSKNKTYTPPVRKFWTILMNEESKHEAMFKEIREIKEKSKTDDQFNIHINMDMNNLKDFVTKVNSVLKEIKVKNISDAEAYSLASLIEAELNEAGFVENIITNDLNIIKKLKQIENDTKKHSMLLINYSKGIR